MKKLWSVFRVSKSTLISAPGLKSARRGGICCLAALVVFANGEALGAPAPPPECCVETNCIPPVKKRYKARDLQSYHQQWGSKIFTMAEHKEFTGWDTPPPASIGATKTHNFGSKVQGLLSADGGATFAEVSLPADVRVRTTHNRMEGDKQVLDAEIELFDITHPTAPVRIRQSPTQRTLGVTTIRPVPGGYAISSYFDVVTEFSDDGGLTWTSSSVTGRVELVEDSPTRVTTTRNLTPVPGSSYCQPTNGWPILFGTNIQARNFWHRRLPNPIDPPTTGQTSTYNASQTEIEADVSTDGGLTFTRMKAPASVSVQIRHGFDAGESRFFETEILALDIQGGALPPGVRLRESPTLASTGEHAMRRSSASSPYQVGSFFDVNLDLSVDNGATWIPASGPVHLDIGPTLSANILFVSDNPTTGDNAFHPPLVGFPDDFYVVMLQNAGHNVRRFNPPDNAATTLLTAAQLTAINTNDLILVSRSIASGGFVNLQASNWNARVTKPLIMTSPYLVRQDGNRLFWFVGGNGQLPDTTPPTRLRTPDTTDPETAFLFEDVLMIGDTMANSFDEVLEQNTSAIVNAPTAGGKVLANANFVPRAGGAAVTGNIIAEFPAGTAVPAAVGGSLGGYRMFFAAGTRELAPSTIPSGAGKDNLTPDGEKIFMRAMALALNNGALPTDLTPVGIVTGPTNVTVVENSSVTFSLVVTGAQARLAQWERDSGDAVTFTNIPGGSTMFSQTTFTFPKLTPADDGALIRVVATNGFGSVTSEVAQLTVLADTTPPTIVRSAGKWTMTNITISFSEPVDPVSATDTLGYSVDNGLVIDSITLDATGTNVFITTSTQLPGYVYTVTVNFVTDLASNPNPIAEDSKTSFTAWVPTRGFLISEIFTGITGAVTAGNDIPMVTGHPSYPNNPSRVAYVNVSSNAPTVPNLDNYGGRLVGWVVPPVSGDYIFYIRGDDDTELRMSPNADSGSRVTVAGPVVTANQAYAASAPQTLTAGQAYFIEALWREGTGGDYMQVGWTPPWATGIEGIPGAYLEQNADAVGVSVNITAQPQGATIEENRSVTFSVSASSTPANALQAYEWQKGDGAGGFTNALHRANSATFTTPLLRFPEDNGSQWRLIVSVPGGSATSEVATVTVNDDVTAPEVVSVGSMDGLQVGVCFSEVIDPNGDSTDPFNYQVEAGGVGVAVSTVTIRPDGRSAVLRLAPPAISGPFTVTVSAVIDLAGNTITPAPVSSAVVGLTGAELGTNLRVGEHWTCDPDIFDVIAGGADIFGTADTGHFASRSVTGDFDAKVRVRDLTLTASTGGATNAKAGLMVRSTGANNSPTIWLLGNAPPPGRDLIESGYRPTSGGATVTWGPNVTNVHMPDMWVRIRRDMNTFNGFVSSNGVDWTGFAVTNSGLPASVLLGAAVTAHNNVAGLASTGRFSNFSVSQPIADLSISQAAAPSVVYVGSNVTYTITAQNIGPDATWNNVIVRIPIAAGSTFVSASPDPEGACTLNGGVVTCEFGPTGVGGELTITLVTTMNVAGMTTNTATVSSTAVDPVAANNTSSAVVEVLAKPVISNVSYDDATDSISMSVPTATGFTYRVEYKNALTDPEWASLAVITGDGTVQTVSYPGQPPPTRFYRIVVE